MPRFPVLVAALVALSAMAVQAQAPTGPPAATTLAFPPGQPLTTVQGEVALGGTQLYVVTARAGQTLLVSVASDEAVTFQVFPPDVRPARSKDGKTLIEGKALPDAGPDDNAKAWVGALPRNGTYLIALGLPETGPVVAPFALTVSLQ